MIWRSFIIYDYFIKVLNLSRDSHIYQFPNTFHLAYFNSINIVWLIIFYPFNLPDFLIFLLLVTDTIFLIKIQFIYSVVPISAPRLIHIFVCDQLNHFHHMNYEIYPVYPFFCHWTIRLFPDFRCQRGIVVNVLRFYQCSGTHIGHPQLAKLASECQSTHNLFYRESCYGGKKAAELNSASISELVYILV